MKTSVNLLDILQEHKDHHGVTLQDHLIGLLDSIIKEKKEKELFDKFETISSFTKANKLHYSAPRLDREVNRPIKVKTELTEWEDDTLEMIGKTTFNLTKSNQLGAVQNYFDDSRVLAAAGLSLGEEESYLISKSLVKLAEKTQAKTLRFWGKIFGTQADYYVAEGRVSDEFADDVPDKTYEPAGQGVNRMTYWVTNSVLEDWKQLPLISPKQVEAARSIKHYFTGNLNEKLMTYPAFPGLEKHYLKAQIARITHSTELAPKGLYKLNDEKEDDPELYFEEEYKYPAWEEVANPESWVHMHQILLKAGRVTHLKPEAVNPDDDPEDLLQKLQENDPTVDRLRDIGQDLFEPEKEDQGDEPAKAWITRTYGETQVYNTLARPGVDEEQTSFAVVAHKSTVWPGACLVASAEKHVNIYFGYGHKKRDPAFIPIHPDLVWEDPDDLIEYPEPNPKNPPPIDQPNPDDGQNPDGDADADADADGDY